MNPIERAWFRRCSPRGWRDDREHPRLGTAWFQVLKAPVYLTCLLLGRVRR